MEKYSKKKFILLWLGEFLSIVGSGITGFALSVSVYQETQMASYYSLITLCTVGPSILVRPFAGALADRYNRRFLMILGNCLAGFGVVAIALFMWFQQGDINIIQICICMIFSSIGAGISLPAYTSAISLLIPEDFYAQASGMLQISGSSQYLVSPLVAGILLPILGVDKIVLIDACTFFLVIFIVFSIKIPLKVENEQEKEDGVLTQIRTAFSYLKKEKIHFLLIITGTLVNFFMGFLIVLIGPMILSFSSSQMLGLGETISAMGMVVGSILVMTLKLPKKLPETVATYVITMGIGYAFMGISKNYFLIIAACILFFYSIPYINTYIDVIFRKTISKNMQGRIYALQGAMVQIGYILSYSIAGILADYVFEPLLSERGALSQNVGKIIGTGNGRGIGFMFLLSGIAIIVIGIILKLIIKQIAKEKKEQGSDIIYE